MGQQQSTVNSLAVQNQLLAFQKSLQGYQQLAQEFVEKLKVLSEKIENLENENKMLRESLLKHELIH